ncbi:hypothetical protein L7F22_001470 [Adiantum nelumboides]|nr:hypothetical protein [Adiantum nelumboides]
MGFMSGTGPLNFAPTNHVQLSRLACSPLILSGAVSRTTTTNRTAPGNGNRVAPLQSEQITKLQTTLLASQELISSFRRMAVLSAPMLLANFSLPPIATALGSEPLSQIIKFFPMADLDPALATLLIRILGPVFTSLNFLFIIRIVMSWYPQLPVDKFPYIIAFAPTEPVLEPTRRLVPPVGGVDISPVIWVAIMSFLNEILLGQQGLLILLSQQRGQI